jgi:hypothetical protein
MGDAAGVASAESGFVRELIKGRGKQANKVRQPTPPSRGVGMRGFIYEQDVYKMNHLLDAGRCLQFH